MEAVSLVQLLRKSDAAGPADRSDPTGRPPGKGDCGTAEAADEAHGGGSASDSVWDVATGEPPFVADGVREYVFAEHGRDGILSGTDVMTMVRDRRWKLVEFTGANEGQLFDLEQDPQERRNLWRDADYAEEKQRLLGVLREWYASSLYHSRKRHRR
jgi:hypothetical protein